MTLLRRLFTAVAVIAAVSVHAQEDNKPPAGFSALFNGTDLTGWWGEKTTDPRKYINLSEADFEARRQKSLGDVKSHWRVENGKLINDGKGLYLTTNKFYGDFEFFVDYKTVAKADSGIYLRGVPQVQIWDYTKEGGKWKIGADKGSGGLWNNPKHLGGKDPLVLADKPFGEWNRMRIVMVGERTSIWLNDKLVVDHAPLNNYYSKKGPKLGVPRSGPIQLQTHGGEIRWKNCFVREIGGDEANKILAAGGVHKTDQAGFTSLFNGKDLSGWKGPVQNYEVVDGSIMCKKGKGGTLHTEGTYADFHVRFEFKLPPGGNNGLAIRYPGGGDTAYVGMCELQVLDNTAQKYAKLDKRQYHGSAYGQAAAQRGYLRPVGDWNYQEVIVKGSTIKVELNGTTILNADLSKVKEFMGKPEKYKGRTNTEGHFGFAGHSDPVQFRNVSIKSL
jgi:hypothetical protein